MVLHMPCCCHIIRELIVCVKYNFICFGIQFTLALTSEKCHINITQKDHKGKKEPQEKDNQERVFFCLFLTKEFLKQKKLMCVYCKDDKNDKDEELKKQSKILCVY